MWFVFSVVKFFRMIPARQVIAMQHRAASLSNRLKPWGMVALVCGLVLACYWRSLSGEFIWNDGDYVTRPALRSVAGLGRIWTELGATEQYYPLLHSAFWVQHRLWGDHPLGYHLVTVLLHAGAAVLFAAVLRRLSVPGAWLAALLFALHPVHVESVAWITEQKNTLSLVFYLLAALMYLRFDDTRRPGAYGAALALFAMSLLCKTVTATLPAALLVSLWWKRGRLTWRRDFRPLLPWLIIGAAAGLFSSWVERRYLGAQGADFALSRLERLIVAGRAFWFYLGQLGWPRHLNFIYPRWKVDVAAGWQWLFPLGALAFVTVLWHLRRRSRAPLAAVLFFAGSLFPVLGFVNLYGAIYSFVWDHWQYLPDLGPLALAASGLMRLQDHLAHRARWVGPLLVVGLVLLLGTLSWNHSGMFHDDETLYHTTLARNPACWMAYNNLAAKLLGDGRVDEAMANLRMALKYGPGNAAAYANLGDALRQKGRMNEAFAQYNRALEIEPWNVAAHVGFGNALLQTGRVDEAMVHYQKAIDIRPDFAKAHTDLGDAFLQTGRVDEAIAQYQKALENDPNDSEAHTNLGTASLQKGRVDEAIAHFQRALEIKPESATAQLNFGNAFLQKGRVDEAIAHYRRALELNPNSSEVHNNLGYGLLQTGRADEAIAHFQKALEIDPNNAAAHRNLGDALLRRELLDRAEGNPRRR